ncbi:hypothetical protein NDU88_004814 [Pleurodeles waltl]|uniref:Uncharacterized protein n=1 Tax=Pleurodeles waltl TaxID=8319 RepID=A0AAV7UJ67_PLEWA|nr:hypothetical protein NDU88_004814 [Pleurodeles waltl]
MPTPGSAHRSAQSLGPCPLKRAEDKDPRAGLGSAAILSSRPIVLQPPSGFRGRRIPAAQCFCHEGRRGGAYPNRVSCEERGNVWGTGQNMLTRRFPLPYPQALSALAVASLRCSIR